MEFIPSVKAFTEKLIDYAGLFPPASLDLKTAFDNYLRYRDDEYNNILSKFIIPAGRLNELEEIIKNFEEPPEGIELSILGTFPAAIKNDISAIRKFNEETSGIFRINTFEMKIPLLGSRDNITDFLDQVSELFDKNEMKNYNIFYECPLNKRELDLITDQLAYHEHVETLDSVKIRTGGTEASAFPSPEEVALAIRICRDKELQLKATAGLHHPARHFNEEVNTKMHGFLNIFSAAIFAHSLKLNEADLLEIISDEEFENFEFESDALRYKTYKADLKAIESARNNFIISFGSCSFTEPIEDLKKISIL
jgi:hypothetical protein